MKRYLLIALIAFAAGMAGIFAGRAAQSTPQHSETEVHALLHGRLDLSADQQRRIDAMETRFAARWREHEQQMRASNARLAAAIELEHGYGPRVTAAIHDTHSIMGDIQSETLRHLFEMRGVLNAEQAAEFDSTVMKALTTPPQ